MVHPRSIRLLELPTIYDAVDVAALPLNANIILGYIDGAYTSDNYNQVRARFPAARILSVTTTGRNRADICDVEKGDATPEIAAAGLRAGLFPTIYSNVATRPALDAACAGLLWNWFAADWPYPGQPANPHIVAGSVATQYASPACGSPGNYDISLSIPNYPVAVDASAPTPVATRNENDMIARNTAGKGYWCVRSSGATYAFDGAPYLGPAQHFLDEWGIGTATIPVVGIVDDGHGGFVLEADANLYPGDPALYHIDSSGQYAK